MLPNLCHLCFFFKRNHCQSLRFGCLTSFDSKYDWIRCPKTELSPTRLFHGFFSWEHLKTNLSEKVQGRFSRDSLNLWESGEKVMNISSPFQTHLDGFTLYIPPYLPCPATQRTKKAIGKKREKTEICPQEGSHAWTLTARGRFLGEFTSFDFEKRL